jgi:hypothetical protein
VVSLLSDPEIRAAYVAQPPSKLESALATARATHGIEIVSESYGKLSRVGVEEWLSELQCSPVSLERYYAVLTELERTREGTEANGALLTKAAGNENARLNGPEDSVECRLGGSRRLLVGSYGTNGQRSNFSNYGDCVDLYAPGEDVIVHLPGDWLFPLSGTSFAAPLVTRLLSMTSPRPFDPDTAKANLLGQRGADSKISRNRFPSTMLWSMTTQTDAAGSQALQTSVRPLRPSPRQVTHLAWHNAVWPIAWVQARRRFSSL